MGNPKRCKEGFSLVEMIIAIAIVGIVMSGVVLLISYSTNNMRRTSNMVNLQNETKDAMMHMSTYIQEGTDAWFDDGEDKALYIISGKKNLTGALSDGITVCRYKFVPDPSTGEETSSEPRGKIHFNKLPAEGGSEIDPASLCDSDGKLDFEYKVKPLFSSVTTDDSTMLVKDVVEFTCQILDNKDTTATPVPSPTTEPTPAATTAPMSDTTTGSYIGGKCVRITMNMKNQTGDAEFSGYKDVYLRNS